MFSKKPPNLLNKGFCERKTGVFLYKNVAPRMNEVILLGEKDATVWGYCERVSKDETEQKEDEDE